MKQEDNSTTSDEKGIETDQESLDVDTVPDGGRTAWIQVCMGHLVFANTWGYINSFGVFQTYYQEHMNRPQADISWVGSIQCFLLLSLAVFSGRALDSGLFRPIFITGSLLQAFGIFMTSMSTSYWHLLLAQGLCTGLGDGLQFCPTVALISTYFSKRRGVAIGLAAAGGATGGMLYPLVAQQLLATVGFGWAVRVQGLIMSVTSLICIIFLKPRPRIQQNKSGRALLDLRAFTDPTFAFYSVGMFLVFWALYFAFYYVGIYGRTVLHISQQNSIMVLLVMNGVGIIGRVAPNYFADHYFGPLNTVIPFTFVCGILLFAWTGVGSQTGLFVFAATYGLSSAVIQSLFPVIVSALTEDVAVAGQRLGMAFAVLSVACLTGPPVAGALIKAAGGRYLYAQVWGGSVLTLGCMFLVAARISKTGFRLRSRV